MIGWLIDIAIIWHAGLILVLMIYAARAQRLVDRIVAFDALSIVFVVALSALAIRRQEAHYLDIALVVAMLGFVQTLAAARLVERRGLR
jgi:multisubunit Na+/H+ antiporter MnhF subunit